MSLRIFYIALFLIASPTLVLEQKNDSTFSRDAYGGKITNQDVIDAKRWHSEGLTEKSLKKGLEILASNIPLTKVDSFTTYQVIAYNLRDMKAHKLALEYAEKAVKIMQRIDPENKKGISWISRYYSAVNDYSKSIFYMKTDVHYFLNEMDTLALLKLYNDIGFTFYLNNKSDSASVYYKKIIGFDKCDDEKYKGIFGLATGNLGRLYFERGEYDKALVKMQLDAKLNRDYDLEGWFNAMNGIGECYYRMGNFEKAKSSLLEIANITPANIKNKLNTYKLLSRIYEKTNNPELSLSYLKEYASLEKEIHNTKIPDEAIIRQLSDANVGGIQKDLEISKAKVDLMNSELLLVHNEKRINSAIAIFSILITIALIFGYKYRQNRQNRQKE